MAGGTPSPDRNTRFVESSRGILTYAQLAPLLAERVLVCEEAIVTVQGSVLTIDTNPPEARDGSPPIPRGGTPKVARGAAEGAERRARLDLLLRVLRASA